MVEIGKAYAFLFPGQGAQKQGMAIDFLETGSAEIKKLFDSANKNTGLDLEKILKSGSDE